MLVGAGLAIFGRDDDLEEDNESECANCQLFQTDSNQQGVFYEIIFFRKGDTSAKFC